MRSDRASEQAGAGRARSWTVLASAALLLVACARREPRPAPPLHPRDVATHASEFFCAHGRWPGDVAELEAFPAPVVPRTGLEPPTGAIPWALLRDAALDATPDGVLRIHAVLPPGRVADQPPERRVDMSLRVEPPGCWPPRLAPSPAAGDRAAR